MAISSKSAEVEELAHTRSSNGRFRAAARSIPQGPLGWPET